MAIHLPNFRNEKSNALHFGDTGSLLQDQLGSALWCLIQSTADVVCVYNTRGEWVYGNPAFEARTCFCCSVFQDKLKPWFHPEEQDCFGIWQGLREQSANPSVFESGLVSSDGSTIWIEWSATELDKEGFVLFFGRDISQKRQDRSLKNLVLESILDYFYMLDRDFCFSYVNRSAEDIMGFPPGTLLGKCIWEVFPVLKSGVFFQNAYKALETQKQVHFEYYSDAVSDWFEESFYPTEAGISVFFRSIGSRKKAELALKEQKDFFEQTLMQSGSSQMIMDKEGWCLRINPATSAIFGVDPKDLEGGDKYNIFQDPEVIRRGVLEDFRKVQQQKIPFQTDLVYDTGYSSKRMGIPCENLREIWLSVTAYPIMDTEGNLSHIVVQHQDISVRKAAEQSLLQSELKYRNLIQNMDLGLLELDNQETIIRSNPRFCQLTGYLETELLGQNVFRLLQPELDWVFPGTIQNRPGLPDGDQYETTFRKKDGSRIHLLVNRTPIVNDSGEPVGYLGIHYDISDRIKAERELKAQKELAETILENIPILIGLLDPEGQLDYVNSCWKKELGWTLDQTREKSELLDLIFPNSNFFTEQTARQNLMMETKWQDFEMPTKSNGFIQTSWIQVQLTDGRKIGIGKDISARKRQEKALKVSHERYEYVTRATFDAIWDSDILNGTVYWGEGFYSLFGYPPQQLAEMDQPFKSFLHPEDEGRVEENFQTALVGKGEVWADEYRFRKANGFYAYVQDRAIIIRDEDGKAIRVTGAMQDITRQKEEEAHLRLLESVITCSTDSIVVAKAGEQDQLKPSIVFANQAFLQMTGYTLEEIKGKPIRLGTGPNFDDTDQARIHQALVTGKGCDFEALTYRKSGEEFWVSFSMIPLHDKKGNISHWISIQRDCTDRKRKNAEREQLVKELTRSNKELKQFSFITSHNMRSPLTNLVAISELLDMGKIEDETTRQLLEGFKSSTRNLNDTLNDLIEILVIKENRMVDVVVQDLEVVCKKVMDSISRTIKESSALIHINFKAAPEVRFNPAYLESIFLNLLTNSIKYARQDRKPIIFIYSMVTEDGVQLVFEDNGRGFNMSKVQHKIFGLYQKFHNHPDSKGIGLYLVHSQVTALGGTIEVESEENEGTKFTITFPGRI